MPISDPRDRFFSPHHPLMKDTCNLTCSMIPSVDLANYGYLMLKFWLSGDCASAASNFCVLIKYGEIKILEYCN